MTIDVRGVCTLVLVFDMPTSLKFYRDVLGFEVIATNDDDAGDDVDWCYLRLGKAELMLNGMYEADDRPPAPDKKRIAAHLDVCLYFGCPDVDAAYRHLRAHGVADGYERLKEFTRGRGVGAAELRAFVATLGLPDDTRRRLESLAPASYTGLAEALARDL